MESVEDSDRSCMSLVSEDEFESQEQEIIEFGQGNLSLSLPSEESDEKRTRSEDKYESQEQEIIEFGQGNLSLSLPSEESDEKRMRSEDKAEQCQGNAKFSWRSSSVSQQETIRNLEIQLDQSKRFVKHMEGHLAVYRQALLRFPNGEKAYEEVQQVLLKEPHCSCCEIEALQVKVNCLKEQLNKSIHQNERIMKLYFRRPTQK